MPLEHDAEEPLTAAPPAQVVGLPCAAGVSACAPSHPPWLERQKATSVFRLQVLSEKREDFPSQTSLLRAQAVPLAALLGLLLAPHQLPRFLLDLFNFLIPSLWKALLQLNTA